MISSSKSAGVEKGNKVPILLGSVLIIAICGILYELLISTISSYFQGSSILHFSIVIGLFLSFMGIGSFLSKYFKRNLLDWFIRFEILLAVVGGFSSLLLYMVYSLSPYFYLVAFIIIGLLGSLIGLEIPLLTRIVRQYESLKDAMAKVLSFDYLGSLIASLAFPLILLPLLGVMRTAFVIGLLNIAVAILNIYLFQEELKHSKLLGGICIGIVTMLITGFSYSLQLTGFFEQFLYRDPIMMSEQSAYQRIVITQRNQDTRLFIDGNIQFSSRDEYRYHEPLVHIPAALTLNLKKVLILGGGDGLATRELLKHEGIDSILVIDLDPEITRLGKRHPIFRKLNENAFDDPRVKIYNRDAYKYLEQSSEIYDLILIDLPDPNNTDLGKLYSREFYEIIQSRLSAGGVVVTQSTSPYFARPAFWCINKTMEAVFPVVLPYSANVPSFGQWGFNLGMKTPGKLKNGGELKDSLKQQAEKEIGKVLFKGKTDFQLKYLKEGMLLNLFEFAEDTSPLEVEINQIHNQKLVQYYESSWSQWE
ncbi:MAG: polyamine aminopropyltransferase [Bacteroidota bacterium]